MNESREEVVSQLRTLGESLGSVQERLAGLERGLAEAKSEADSRIIAIRAFLESGSVTRLMGPDPAAGADLSQANESIQKLALGENQERILEIFLQEAKRFVNRAILFMRKDEEFHPFKSLGFNSDDLEGLAVEDPQDALQRAASQKRIIYRADAILDAFPWLESAGPVPETAVCIPLVFHDSVPAVFYGDAGAGIHLDALELLTHLTTLVLRNNYLELLLTEGGVASVEAEASSPPLKAVPEAPAAAAVEETPVEEPPAEEPRVEEPHVEEATVEQAATEEPPAVETPAEEPAWRASEAPPMEIVEMEAFEEVATEPTAVEASLEAEEAIEAPPVEEKTPEAVEEVSFHETAIVEEEVHAPEEAPTEYGYTVEKSMPVEPVDSWIEPAAEEVSESEEGAFLSEMSAVESSGAVPVEEPPPPADAEAPPAEEEEAKVEMESVPAVVDEPPLPREEWEKVEQEARRFARLLVSEIKLYNEDAVEQGREEEDLYARLRRDIDRSREMYEKRAHPAVRSREDFFHAELVRILAQGHEDRMGPDYPGQKLS